MQISTCIFFPDLFLLTGKIYFKFYESKIIILMHGNNNVRSRGLIGTRRRYFFPTSRKTSDNLDFVKGAVATTVSLSFVHSTLHKCAWARVTARVHEHACRNVLYDAARSIRSRANNSANESRFTTR